MGAFRDDASGSREVTLLGTIISGESLRAALPWRGDVSSWTLQSNPS